MQGRALGPVVLRPALVAGARQRPCCAGPTCRAARSTSACSSPIRPTGPGRGSRLLGGLRLGLDQARDLDVSGDGDRRDGVRPRAPRCRRPRCSKAAPTSLVVTTTGVAGLVGPLCATRGVGLVVADEGDRVSHPAVAQERRAPPYRAALAGGLRARPVGRAPPRRRALPAAHARRGAGRRCPRAAGRLPGGRRRRRRLGRGLAQERHGRRTGGPRLRGPGGRGARHRPPAERDRPGPAGRAGAGRDRRRRPRASTSAPWPSSAAEVLCTPPPPGTAPTSPTWSSPSSGAPASGPTPSPLSGTTSRAFSSTPAGATCCPTWTTDAGRAGLVVRRRRPRAAPASSPAATSRPRSPTSTPSPPCRRSPRCRTTADQTTCAPNLSARRACATGPAGHLASPP